MDLSVTLYGRDDFLRAIIAQFFKIRIKYEHWPKNWTFAQTSRTSQVEVMHISWSQSSSKNCMLPYLVAQFNLYLFGRLI